MGPAPSGGRQHNITESPHRVVFCCNTGHVPVYGMQTPPADVQPAVLASSAGKTVEASAPEEAELLLEHAAAPTSAASTSSACRPFEARAGWSARVIRKEPASTDQEYPTSPRPPRALHTR
jgi:hypothetical protein